MVRSGALKVSLNTAMATVGNIQLKSWPLKRSESSSDSSDHKKQVTKAQSKSHWIEPQVVANQRLKCTTSSPGNEENLRCAPSLTKFHQLAPLASRPLCHPVPPCIKCCKKNYVAAKNVPPRSRDEHQETQCPGPHLPK